MNFKKIYLGTLVIVSSFCIQAQTNIDVNIDMKHTVGDVSTLDRQKFLTLHATINGHDWKNETEKMDYVFGDLDVYCGRDNGGVNWHMGQAPEDPSRPGYADSTYVINAGKKAREEWKNDSRNKYDNKSDVMIGGQNSAMWPGHKNGWELQGGDAVGEFMAKYIKHFYRDINDTDKNNGHPAPRLLEVVNEPLYELHDDGKIAVEDKVPFIDIFLFHRDVAQAFKKFNSTTKIGGYTVAFPEYDIDDFQRWEDRMKLFIDSAGAYMDYYSLHLYDFNRHWKTDNKHHINFKGARTEATLDMLEQYGILKFGEVKPMLFSEIGGRDHKLESAGHWSPERDWHNLKAMSPYLLQMMERANNIEKVIPFIMTKAVWSQTPHTAKLLRQTREPEDYVAGDYDTDFAFTEMIKLYELWSDVNGVRIDTNSDNPDVLADAYVDGNKAYLIFSNLGFNSNELNLNIQGDDENIVSAIKVKHLYADVNDKPVLEITSPSTLTNFVLAPEATVIVEYIYNKELVIDETLLEHKYYATSYLKPIKVNETISFDIKGVQLFTNGEAELRVSFGREHNKSKLPEVKLNGVSLNIPENIAGETQEYREEGFFGTIAIPVPSELLMANNKIDVKFPDTGGHISSITLRTFEMSKAIKRSNSVTGISLYPNEVEIGVNQTRILTPTLTPANAYDIRINWTSSNNDVVSVDYQGNITGKGVGSATIVATTLDGGYTASCAVDVKSERIAVAVDQVIVSPSEAFMVVGENLQLSYVVLPIDADDKTVSWSSQNNVFASVSNTGLVNAKNDGKVNVVATSKNGVTGVCIVSSQTKVDGSVVFSAPDAYKNDTYISGGAATFSSYFQTTTGTTVSKDGVKFWFRELTSSWTPVNDFTASDLSAAGKESGTATATIDLDGAIPTAQLPNGNFYFLWITFEESDGNVVNGQSISKVNVVKGTGKSVLELVDVEVYPNPVDDRLTIKADTDFLFGVFYNINGLVQDRIVVSENTMNVSDLPSGIYFLQLVSETQHQMKKVFIQH